MSFDWKQFPVTVSFLEPCVVQGIVAEIERLDSGAGATLTLKSPDGLTFIVNAVQTQLRSQLVLRDPQKGDKVRITFHGAAKKSAPGMSPTKEFTVEVWPQGSQPPAAVPPAPTGGKTKPEAGK